jgi:hypothetical protein
MVLRVYALCVHPLLRKLEEQLPCFKSARGTCITPVVAYVDDVSLFVTQPEEFTIIQQAVRCYERATGAKLNPQKSKAVAIGNWTEPATALGFPFHSQATILGVNFGNTMTKTIADSWVIVVRSVCAQA